jgi:hypothetical protein
VTPVSHVALVNRSQGLLSDEVLASICEGYREAMPAFCAAWGLPLIGLAVYPSDHKQVPQEEACIFVTNSMNDPDTFGAHTRFGKYIWGYADVALANARGEPISRIIGHEIFELGADPGLDIWADVGGGERVALEVSDSPQRYSTPKVASFFGHTSIVEIAAYCLPNFYKPGADGPYDSMGILSAPLEVAPGGYITRRQAGAVVVEGAARVTVTSYGRTFRRMAGAPSR